MVIRLGFPGVPRPRGHGARNRRDDRSTGGDRPGPGTERGQFKDPIGIAVGADGVIAAVDSGNARVQRFDRDGKFLGIWGEDEGGVTFTRTDNGLGPTGVTIAPDGTTWVADTWGHSVVALDANGAAVQTIGAETVDTGDDPGRVDETGGRFFGPRDIAVSDAAIYVVDTGNERVQLFTRDGAFVDAWGGYGSGPDQLIEPVGIALGPDGNVYVADSGSARISIFTPDGESVRQWAVAVWPAPAPGGLPPAYQPYLAFDADGNLYATASNAGQVLMFDDGGAMISTITDADGEGRSGSGGRWGFAGTVTIVPRRAARCSQVQRRGHGSICDRHSHLRPHHVDVRHAGTGLHARAREHAGGGGDRGRGGARCDLRTDAGLGESAVT